MTPLPDDALAAASAARREAAGLRTRIEAAEANLAATAALVAERSAALTDAESDVERLESLSFTKILANLRGSRATDLERESAERDAARYAARDAEARHVQAQTELDAARSRLDGLGDVDAAYATALNAKEAWATGHDPALAERLTALATRRGELDSEDREAKEAHDAGVTAHNQIAEAVTTLSSARAWSGWDTFMGGGLFTDLVKHSKLDQVAQQVREADVSLRAFSRELADLRLADVPALNLSSALTAFDVWFDNLFSDLMVLDRINESLVRLTSAAAQVRLLVLGLRERRQTIATELAAIATERDQLLNT